MTYRDIRFKSLATNIRIMLYDDKAQKLNSPCDEILKNASQMVLDYHKVFSLYDINSHLFKLNKSEHSRDLNPDLFELINFGLKNSKDSSSNLNICLGPLIKLWNIKEGSGTKPSSNEIAKAIELTNPFHVDVNLLEKSIRFNRKNMAIDLGALAKGYIADKLKAYLLSQGVLSALIDLGGNIITIGFNLGRPDINWQIAIKKAFAMENEPIIDLELNDLSLVTSGISVRNFVVDGHFYHHILDRKTGFPIVTDMVSLSILAESSLSAENYSTSLYGKNFDEIEELSRIKGFSALAQYMNGSVKSTESLEKYILRKYYD